MKTTVSPMIRLNSNLAALPNSNALCLILLIAIAQLFNPEAVFAQSSVIAVSGTNYYRGSTSIPNSITAKQLGTEAHLAQPPSKFGFSNDTELNVEELMERLGVTTFIDTNLEGVLDKETMLEIRVGVTMYKSLYWALQQADSRLLVESDGSILILSVDDELEPDYLRNVTYDISSLAPSNQDATALANSISQSIASDSWDQNGGGNGVITFFSHNNRMLMTVNNSYKVHLNIRAYLESTARLGGSFSVGEQRVFGNQNSLSNLAASRVIDMPASYRNRSASKNGSRNRMGAGFGGGGLGGAF